MSNLRTAAEQALQYRKKPVVIEAFQMTRERRKDNRDWPAWLNEAWCKPFDEVGAVSCEDYPNSVSLTDRLVIRTLEGVMTVGWDDWIIRGVAGELYACKPDIFAATYESVALAAEQPQPEANDADTDQPAVLVTLIRHALSGNTGGVRAYAALIADRMDATRPDAAKYLRRALAGDDGERVYLAAPPPAAPQPEAQPVAVVTECEACFTPDVCQLRGKCDHYSTDWLRVAPPPAAPQAEAPSQFARGIDAAARFVEKRLADYDAEHGSTDSDTGAREYPGTGDEYVCELAEIAEAIRGLAPPPAAPAPSGWIACSERIAKGANDFE